MVGREIAPTEIGKHSKLIRIAQADMASMDVLVCGRCLSVFHFVEEFSEHKQHPCQKNSNSIRECNDTKPKVWAFLLWKATYLQNNKDTETDAPNSWGLYQTWVKMEEHLRDTWIVAGKTIQSFARVSQGNLHEMPVKITKTVVNANSAETRKPLAQTKPQVANLQTVKLPTVVNKTSGQDAENDISAIKPPGAAAAAAVQKLSKKTTVTGAVVGGVVVSGSGAGAGSGAAVATSGATAALTVGVGGGGGGGGSAATGPTAAAAAVTIAAVSPPIISKTNATKQQNRMAIRTVAPDKTTEDLVDKIVAKRFNPRRKTHEYLVKWDERTHEQNTWEPASHLEAVPHLLDTFEVQLARQKVQRAAMQAKHATDIIDGEGSGGDTSIGPTKTPKGGTVTVAVNTGSTHKTTKSAVDGNAETPKPLLPVASEATSGRPSRTSKTKAMDQVKQWTSGVHSSGGGTPTIISPRSSISPVSYTTEPQQPGGNLSTTGVKRKLLETEKSVNETQHMNTSSGMGSGTATSTLEDLEEDLIPSHTVKRMKNGDTVSVEVKTKNDRHVESKLIKVNGTAGTSPTRSAAGTNEQRRSGDVIIAPAGQASGVVKKPGFNSNGAFQRSEGAIRVLTKSEETVTNTGVVRLRGGADLSIIESKTQQQPQQPVASTPIAATIRTGQIRIGQTRPVVPPPVTSTVGNTQITSITSQQGQTIHRTPAGTIIQRKTVPAPAASSSSAMQRITIPPKGRTQSSGVTMSASTSTPTSGRLIIPRQIGGGATTVTPRPAPPANNSKAITPEQKILQLSKSGDLKVTKKVMTREDVAARNMTPQQRQQHLRQQQQQQQQQQGVQIQKVQQIAPPTSRVCTVTVRKQSDKDEEQQQLPAATEQQMQTAGGAVIQTQIASRDQQQQQHQQLAIQQQEQAEPQDIDPSILLSGDHAMLTNEDGSPLLVTGEDGTVYQVAGKNSEGQTILVTQGPDGEQQFAYVAAAEAEPETTHMLTLDHAVAEAVAQLPAEQQAEALAAAAAGEGQYLVKTTQEDGTTQMIHMTESQLAQHQALVAQQQQEASGSATPLSIQTEAGDGQEANIPAEVVQADLPSPGGTRRVVLLLPDGTFMMTEMHDDEYKALNIAP